MQEGKGDLPTQDEREVDNRSGDDEVSRDVFQEYSDLVLKRRRNVESFKPLDLVTDKRNALADFCGVEFQKHSCSDVDFAKYKWSNERC